MAPSAPASDAADVADLCSGYGLELDVWQRIALERGLGLAEDGSWAADTVAVCAPRQSGKGCLIEALALAGVLLFGERVIACSAHEARTTRLSFERVLAWFDSFDDLRKRVASVQRWVGREQIRFRDGQLLIFPARSRGALRGYSCDRLLLDEAQYLTDAQHEAVLPTLSARPRTQVWHLGTVPTHLGDGEVFGRLRADALGGCGGGRLCYLEWSADPGCDLDDVAAWADANPALGRRISVEAVATERRELSDAGFARERLGLWPVDRVEHIFAPGVWESLAAPGPAQGTVPTAIGVDGNPRREFAIAAAWRTEDDRCHVELIDVADSLDAMAWVVERAARRRVPVVIDGMSPAMSMMSSPLESQRVKVTKATTQQMAGACGAFVDDVVAGRLTHADSSAQSLLAAAVADARKRPSGEAGAFTWDRRDGFMAPLVAATLARHGAVSARRSGHATFV